MHHPAKHATRFGNSALQFTMTSVKSDKIFHLRHLSKLLYTLVPRHIDRIC